MTKNQKRRKIKKSKKKKWKKNRKSEKIKKNLSDFLLAFQAAYKLITYWNYAVLSE